MKFILTLFFLIFFAGSTFGQLANKTAPLSDGIQVMTYNIRYDNPDDGINSWDKRKERLSNLIEFYSPAILGIQEGLHHQVTYLDKKLKNYSWIGVGRNDGKLKGEFSAIYYDTTKVSLVENSDNTFWLSETPHKPSKSWDAALPRIVTSGKFRIKHGSKTFSVLNTHFDHRGDTARVNSAKLIINKISKQQNGEPVLVMGDFNSTPQSQPYRILSDNKNGLRDAMGISDIAPIGPNFTYEGFSVQSNKNKRRIDHIFVSNGIDVNSFGIISSFRDGRYPSDHLPVISEVEINP